MKQGMKMVMVMVMVMVMLLMAVTSMKQGMKVALATITRSSHSLSGSSSRPALIESLEKCNNYETKVPDLNFVHRRQTKIFCSIVSCPVVKGVDELKELTFEAGQCYVSDPPNLLFLPANQISE